MPEGGTRLGRLRLPAAQRRTQLLEVAGRLFADLGYHGLSMEHLAETAGVTKPVLYQHFPSKRDLYLALVREGVAESEAQVRKALEGTDDNRARVEGAIAAYVDLVADRRFPLLFGSAGPVDEEVAALLAEGDAAVSRLIGGLIAEDAGLEPPAALLLASALRGLAVDGARWFTEHAELDRAEAARLLARLAWRGIGGFRPEGPSMRGTAP